MRKSIAFLAIWLVCVLSNTFCTALPYIIDISKNNSPYRKITILDYLIVSAFVEVLLMLPVYMIVIYLVDAIVCNSRNTFKYSMAYTIGVSCVITAILTAITAKITIGYSLTLGYTFQLLLIHEAGGVLLGIFYYLLIYKKYCISLLK